MTHTIIVYGFVLHKVVVLIAIALQAVVGGG